MRKVDRESNIIVISAPGDDAGALEFSTYTLGPAGKSSNHGEHLREQSPLTIHRDARKRTTMQDRPHSACFDPTPLRFGGLQQAQDLRAEWAGTPGHDAVSDCFVPRVLAMTRGGRG